MSVDFTIHVLPSVPEAFEEEVRGFLFNTITGDRWSVMYEYLRGTSSFYIEEVTWDHSPTSKAIQEAIGYDLAVLDESLVATICASYDTPDASEYDKTEKNRLEAFLRRYMGRKVFTINW